MANKFVPSSWKATLVLFFLTSMIESLGMSHVFSFLPVYLESMHVNHVTTWVGILSAVTFVVGLPLVPLWGVWANRFGGKAVVIRSAYVEMIVFVALGVSQNVVGVFAAMALVGFQLGNTGIMLSALRSRVPQDRVGYAISLFSVSSPIGMALGPLVGGWLMNQHWLTLHSLYMTDAVLSFATGTMLLIFYREGHTLTSSNGEQSAWATAWHSVRFTFSLRITWVLFGVYSVLMVARQMVNPYLPVAILKLQGTHGQDALRIGALMGLTALVGAVITVLAGKLGDKVGFPRILAVAFCVSVPVTACLGMVRDMAPFTIFLTLFSATTSIGGAMIFSLFSTKIPATHRSTALNLVYLPLYLGGIIGPAIGSGISRLGLAAPFIGAGAVFLVGFVLTVLTILRRSTNATRGADAAANL